MIIGNGIIHTFVNEGEKEEQFKVLKSMANIHYSIHIIDLTKDTVQELTAGEDVRAIANRTNNALDLMRTVIKDIKSEYYR